MKAKFNIDTPPCSPKSSWQSDFDEYIRDIEPNEKGKGENWGTAIGLQAVDGLTPSEYLLDVARKNISGDISIKEANNLIETYYSKKNYTSPESAKNQECDVVSARITAILSENTFNFTPAYLRNIHKRLFAGIIERAGSYRDFNITKKEWVLSGDTVAYSSFDMIEETVEYDFQEDRKNDYDKLNDEEILDVISKFISGIWQIHPFCEGNTRTVAVLLIKRLNSLGFRVNNEPFKNNSWFFRNALVRANYRNRQEGVAADDLYLKLILRNAMFHENNELKNRSLHIDWKN